METNRTVLSPGLRIARNALYLSISEVGVRAITAVVAILVARYLGPENYGLLSIALALAGIGGYLTDLGVTPVMIREGTKAGAPIPRVLHSALRLRLIFALGATVVMAAVAWFYYPTPLARLAILIVVLPAIWAGIFRGLSSGYFQMMQEMQYTALINGVSAIAGAVVLLFGVLFRWPFSLLALGYGGSAVVGGALGILLLRQKVQIEKGWHPGLVQGLWAFTLGGGLGLLLPQLGPLILPHAAGLEETGFFSAAFRILGALLVIPGVVATAFYPHLFALAAQDRERHLALSLRELRISGTIGLVVAVPLALHARGVVGLLFGPEWVERTGEALILLCGSLALAGLSWPLADALTTQGLQTYRTAITGVLVILGAAGYWVGGRRLGVFGGALAALLVEVGAALGFLLANPRWRALVRRGMVPWAVKALLLVPVAWGCKWFLGSGLLALFVEAVAVSGVALILDRELRHEMQLVLRGARRLFF